MKMKAAVHHHFLKGSLKKGIFIWWPYMEYIYPTKNILKVVSDLTKSNILTFTLSDFVLLIRDPSVTG